ncbi:GQ67_05162T0 [Komagataella phaffii]|nr:GQ67_05162T0 [Komagataella phaffii]AOA70414.1 GQ68_05144T0 [Komagataella phaffii GS115]
MKNQTQFSNHAGDISHLISILILIHAVSTTKSAQGISLKTQAAYVVVFVSRYLDLFFRYVSLYNTLMKLFFIVSSIYVVFLLNRYKKNSEKTNDIFPVWYLFGGAFVFALIFNYEFSIVEILWSFSLWLESVAIIPQLVVLQRTGEAQLLTTHYIFALGLYRALYIPNWIYRYYTEGRMDKIAVISGILQTIVYSDFFYIYYKKVVKNLKFKLPE